MRKNYLSRPLPRSILGSALVVLATSSCDSRNPFGPGLEPGPPAGAFVETPTEIFATSFAVPSDNRHEYAGEQLQWHPMGALPDSSWVVVSVDGGVLHTANYGCGELPPHWNCESWPLDGQTTGPMNLNGSGFVELQDMTKGGLIKLRPVGGTADQALSARALFFQKLPGQVGARRRIVTGGYQGVDPVTGSTAAAQYFLSGQQVVSVTAVPIPIRITAPSSIATGDTAEFKLEVVGDFPLENPHGYKHLPPIISWNYYKNDTLPTSGIGAGGQFVSVSQCNNQLVCRYAPTVPGRMRVTAYVAEQSVANKSAVVRFGARQCGLPAGGALFLVVGSCDPTLNVVCTGEVITGSGVVTEVNRVTRGATVTCVPTASSGTVQVQGWTFQGEGFTYPDLAAGDPEVTSPTWSGKMALSGTVTVQTTIDGVVQPPKSAAISVLPRTAFLSLRVPVVPRRGVIADLEANDRPQDPPQQDSDLGRAAAQGVLFGYPQESGAVIDVIGDGGPNDGAAYLTGVPMRVDAFVVIHPALAIGTAFYQAQALQPDGDKCLQSDFPVYISLVEEHEGVNANAISHIGYYEAALNPNAARAVEHLTASSRAAGGLAAMADEWRRLLRPVVDAAIQRFAYMDVQNPVPFGCEFNYAL